MKLVILAALVLSIALPCAVSAQPAPTPRPEHFPALEVTMFTSTNQPDNTFYISVYYFPHNAPIGTDSVISIKADVPITQLPEYTSSDHLMPPGGSVCSIRGADQLICELSVPASILILVSRDTLFIDVIANTQVSHNEFNWRQAFPGRVDFVHHTYMPIIVNGPRIGVILEYKIYAPITRR